MQMTLTSRRRARGDNDGVATMPLQAVIYMVAMTMMMAMVARTRRRRAHQTP